MEASYLGTPSSLKMHSYIIACSTGQPRWQDRCYRASRELCLNYLVIL